MPKNDTSKYTAPSFDEAPESAVAVEAAPDVVEVEPQAPVIDYAALENPDLYLTDYTSDTPSEMPLPFKPGFDGRGFNYRFFRPDEIDRQMGGARSAGHWQEVKPDGATANFPHADMFGDPADPNSAWGPDGRIGKGGWVSIAGKQRRELVLCVRPWGAFLAEQRHREKQTDQNLGRDNADFRAIQERLNVNDSSGQPLVRRVDVPMVTSSGWNQIAPAKG